MMLSNIAAELKKVKKVAIIPHVSPDGDAIGSTLALALTLRNLGKDVLVFIEEDIPENLKFLPGQEYLIIPESFDNFLSYEAAVAVDCGDLKRLGKNRAVFEGAGITFNIDHHVTNTMYGKINHVEINASSSGEIIYSLIKELGVSLDKKIATLLYTAISTDTGCFKYSNTKPLTLRIMADILEVGIDIAELAYRLFDVTTVKRMKLNAEAANNIQLIENGKISVLEMTPQVLEKLGCEEDECEGLVNIGRNLEGVEVSLFLKEKSDGTVKANLRSNAYADVSKIASEFGGGGHKRAAGFTINGKIQDVKDAIIERIRQEIV